MPSERPGQRLADILEHIELIEQFTAGMSQVAFSGNPQAIYASLHALLILSEAATKLGPVAETLVPGQPWQAIRSIGNVLRHRYDSVDADVIWRLIASGDLASLKAAVVEALGQAAP